MTHKLRSLIKCGHFIITKNCVHCQGVEKHWYQKIKQDGFEEIENQELGLLKEWSGVHEQIDFGVLQDFNTGIQSSWPETNFKKEEEFLNHSSFRSICHNLFTHGNSAIKPREMIRIWKYHCEGYSLREIESVVKIHNSTIYRGIQKLRELMDLMELDPTEKVVFRFYDPQTDLPFLYASWKNSVWYESHPNSLDKPSSAFLREMTTKINLILEKPKTVIRVASLKYNLDQIIGYSVLSDKTVEFVYVKLAYRKQGIAKHLVKGFEDIISPFTKLGKIIAKKKELIIKENYDNSREELKKA